MTAVNPTLQEREEAFDRVGVRFGAVCQLARPFFLAVVHGVVAGKPATDAAVGAQLVGHQSALGVCRTEHDAAQRRSGDVLDLLRPHPATTLDQGDDRHAIGTRALPLPAEFGMQHPGRAVFRVDGISFVRLDNLSFAAEWTRTAFVQCEPDAVHKEPCLFQAAPKSALYLARRDALLARANQVDRLKPNVQWDMARFENRPHPHRKRLAASPALPKTRARALTLQPGRFADCATVWANRTIGPQPAFDIGDCGFFVPEMGGVEGGLHGGFPLSASFYL